MLCHGPPRPAFASAAPVPVSKAPQGKERGSMGSKHPPAY